MSYIPTPQCAHCPDRVIKTMAGWIHMESDSRFCVKDGTFIEPFQTAFPKLTPAQNRCLGEVRAGKRTYSNTRQLRPLERLAELDLTFPVQKAGNLLLVCPKPF